MRNACAGPSRDRFPRTPIPEGTHSIGPSNGSLTVKTGREGAAAKAGHGLVLGVDGWEATVEGGDSPSIRLTADPGSMEVIQGTGGAKSLSDKDKGEIKKNITGKVLGSSQISFQSRQVTDSSAAGIKQYKALMGALKVADEVTVEFRGTSRRPVVTA